jgi:hypothetical protein
VHLASKTLGNAPLGTSTSSAGLSGGIPGGTIASFIAAYEDVPFNHLLLSACDWSLSPVPGARSPTPSLVYRLGPGSLIVGCVAVFERINRALVQRTAGLREHARREAQLSGRSGRGGGAGASRDLACYGPAFTYSEFIPTGNTLVAFIGSLAIGFMFAALTFVAPVRVVVFSTLNWSRYSSRLDAFFFTFTGTVVSQASGDAARLRARRPVRIDQFLCGDRN